MPERAAALAHPRLLLKDRPLGEAVLLAIVLSALFVTLYGWTNGHAATLDQPRSLFWSWELQFPFVPELILPYMSIDLFFLGSFLLFSDRRALRAYSLRLGAAIVTASACFALFPLVTAYPRPHVGGWPAPLFALLWSFDQPHNLVPSLHVALGVILWTAYARTLSGWLRRAVDVWFALILVSPVLTWQHHVIDVVTGLALGVACLYLIDEGAVPTRGSARARNEVAAKWYALGSLAYLGMGIALWPWGSLLFWPAAALGLLALAYMGWGAAIFRKQDGQLSLAARIVLAPYRAGAWASYLVYRRKVPAFAEIVPGLYVGRRLLGYEARALKRLGVRSVLDLTAEYGECEELMCLEVRNVQVLDRTAPSPEQLVECVEFIESRIAHGPVYVHCALGYSRSACVAAAYLMKSGAALSVDEAFARVASVRPEVVITEDLRRAIRTMPPRS